MNKKLIDKIIIIVIFLIILFIIYSVFAGLDKGKLMVACSKNKMKGDNFLLVIAHPDDEAMFFMPTLYNLKEKEKKLFIFCLSDGNAYGKGKTRRQEFEKSCQELGIVDFKIGNFEDNPKREWDPKLAKAAIEKQIKLWNIDSVITFDEKGVSGHPNHISCYKALQEIKDVKKYKLHTGTPKSDKFVYYFPLEDSAMARKHMAFHESQNTWFRKAYIHISRYSVSNYLAPF